MKRLKSIFIITTLIFHVLCLYHCTCTHLSSIHLYEAKPILMIYFPNKWLHDSIVELTYHGISMTLSTATKFFFRVIYCMIFVWIHYSLSLSLSLHYGNVWEIVLMRTQDSVLQLLSAPWWMMHGKILKVSPSMPSCLEAEDHKECHLCMKLWTGIMVCSLELLWDLRQLLLLQLQ